MYEMGDVGQRIQNFSYKRNKFWEPHVHIDKYDYSIYIV